jgi:hypothetical protein
MASGVATRYGVSHYRAEKWVSCAHKLGSLPRIAEALATGQLSMEWLRQVSCRSPFRAMA